VYLAREGVQSETIYKLKLNTVYFIKVRGQNGCAVGDWSNVMTFKTDSKIYYKNFSPKIIKTLTLIKNNEPTESTITPVLQKNQNNLNQPTPIPEIKKKCFLWWCY